MPNDDFNGFDSASVDDASVENQEVAEPVEEDTEYTDDPEEEGEGEEEQEPAEPAQSDEDNAKYAAARRKAEQERDIAIKEAIAKRDKERDEELNQLFEYSNLYDPYTQQPVKNAEDFKKWQETFAKENDKEIREKFEEAGLSEKDIDQLINSHSAVRKAKKLERELEQNKRQVDEQRFRGMVDESLKQIQEYDPSIKSIKDLHESEHGAEIEEKLKQGYSIADAWKLANLDIISERKAKAASIETANKVRSKEHLKKSGSRGQGEVSVPDNLMKEFLKFNPKATKEEIQKFYAKDVKQFKRKKG